MIPMEMPSWGSWEGRSSQTAATALARVWSDVPPEVVLRMRVTPIGVIHLLTNSLLEIVHNVWQQKFYFHGQMSRVSRDNVTNELLFTLERVRRCAY